MAAQPNSEAAAATLVREKTRELARELVGGEGRFAESPQAAAPAPVDDFFADVETRAKARFSLNGSERQEARRELQKQRQATQAKAARQQASSPEQFHARLAQIRGASTEQLQEVEDSVWYASLSFDKREQVDTAITDALIRDAGAEQPPVQDATSIETPGLVGGEADPNYTAWLEDDSGLVEDPGGAEGVQDLD